MQALQFNCWTSFTGDSFIVVKACVESATLFRWGDYWRMMHHYAADSLNGTLQLENPVCPIIISWGRRRDSFMPFLRLLALSETQTALSRNWTWVVKSPFPYEDDCYATYIHIIFKKSALQWGWNILLCCYLLDFA